MPIEIPAGFELCLVQRFFTVKEYGFARVMNPDGDLTAEEVFIGYNSGRYPAIVDGEIVFRDKVRRKGDGSVEPVPTPSGGVLLIFQRKVSEDRVSAQPWGFKRHFDAIMLLHHFS